MPTAITLQASQRSRPGTMAACRRRVQGTYPATVAGTKIVNKVVASSAPIDFTMATLFANGRMRSTVTETSKTVVLASRYTSRRDMVFGNLC